MLSPDQRSCDSERMPVQCPKCSSEDLHRDRDSADSPGIPIICNACGHRFTREPRIVCPRCGSVEVDESSVEGWAYDDPEEGREHPETAAWSYVDRLLYRCERCRHDWQAVASVRPYTPKPAGPA